MRRFSTEIRSTYLSIEELNSQERLLPIDNNYRIREAICDYGNGTSDSDGNRSDLGSLPSDSGNGFVKRNRLHINANRIKLPGMSDKACFSGSARRAVPIARYLSLTLPTPRLRSERPGAESSSPFRYT
jgi:hypothetical protein